MNNAQLINQTSKNTEYYTPFEYVEAARAAMGGIDYDPASSSRANEFIQAADYGAAPTYEDVVCDIGLPYRVFHGRGGLDEIWCGRVWMNHPFGTGERYCKPRCTKKTCHDRGWHTADDLPGNNDWVNHMISDYVGGDIVEAYMICFASTSEAWFKPLKAYPQCYIDGRVNYLDPDTLKEVKGVTKGSVITYFGDRVDLFHKHFNQFGEIHVPYRKTMYVVQP